MHSIAGEIQITGQDLMPTIWEQFYISIVISGKKKCDLKDAAGTKREGKF